MSAPGGQGLWRRVAIGAPFLWLLALFLAPFLIVLKISLSDAAISIPPYAPQFDWAAGWPGLVDPLARLDLENYAFIAADPLYLAAALSSLWIAGVATFLTLLIGYPIALALARAPAAWRPLLVTLVILPFWTSLLIRVYSWIGILRGEGFLYQALAGLGLIDAPVAILNSDLALFLGVVYAYLPFMIMPIYATLSRMDPALIEAAEDLGCTRRQAFWLVTWPLSRPGVAAGCLLVFAPALGEVVIPSLLGGSDTLMIGKTLWDEFFRNRDWPLASAVAVLLLALALGPALLFIGRALREDVAATPDAAREADR